MKIFLSHSSKNKPLVREIRTELPEHIKLWIDEKDLLIGEDIEGSLKNAVESNSDYVIIFLDKESIKSKWVDKELTWALEHEKKIGRVFILPIILDAEVLNSKIKFGLSKRKYLKCSDYSENSIKNLASEIIKELFAWLSREIDNKTQMPDVKIKALQTLEDADQFLANIADNIRLIVYFYHRKNPLEIKLLWKSMSGKKEFADLTFSHFLKLLDKIQQQGFLPGIVYDGYNIFIEEEHFAWKTSVFSSAKSLIAKKAVSYIKSGDTVALDAGSTTLEVAKHIGQGLKKRIWRNLKIVTNSIAGSYEILKTASEMGWDDNNSLVEVYIVGGRVRANTLAVVNDDSSFPDTDLENFDHIFSQVGKADIAFIGTNGIVPNIGFTTHDIKEVCTKQNFMLHSKRNVILSDPSKFGIKEDLVYATFDKNLEVITTKDGFEDIIDEYQKILEGTNTKIVVI